MPVIPLKKRVGRKRKYSRKESTIYNIKRLNIVSAGDTNIDNDETLEKQNVPHKKSMLYI